VVHSVRPAAVAGSFYPRAAGELGDSVDALLAGAAQTQGPRPKAIIAPHAGYVYSGPIAASAFSLFGRPGPAVTRVVLVGPAHRSWVDGLAASDAVAFETPLGRVKVDLEALARVSGVPADAAAHAEEHSLEVELPFIQRVAPEASIVPFVVGDARAEEVAQVLDALWGGPETVIVVSSDLSHYLDYRSGRGLDERTAASIVALDPRPLDPEHACGARGIDGLVRVARRRGLRAELVDLRSSGDTAGDRARVVGYGAFAFYERERSESQ